MGGHSPDKFVLKRKDKAFLLDVLRDGQTPLKVARRALILLGRANGQQSIATSEEKVEQDRTTIWRVCERYEDGGAKSCNDLAPRSLGLVPGAVNTANARVAWLSGDWAPVCARWSALPLAS